MAKDERMKLSPLGEFYEDLLTIDSAINARTVAAQGASLLCAKLQERQTLIQERLEYLAEKRGISAKELRKQILQGTFEKLDPEDIVNGASE